MHRDRQAAERNDSLYHAGGLLGMREAADWQLESQ